ncbi:MAG: hypothetical protein L3J76_02640 [Candidatus Hydrothermae bacterium]|nr:hypothetical protein [Candidatus Hydrothermae bacterium]
MKRSLGVPQVLMGIYLFLLLWFSLFNFEWLSTPIDVRLFPRVHVILPVFLLFFLLSLLLVLFLSVWFTFREERILRQLAETKAQLYDEERRAVEQLRTEILDRLSRIEAHLGGSDGS